MRPHTIAALCVTLITLPVYAQLPAAPTNLDFEAGGTTGAAPRGWNTFTSPAGLAFRAVLTTSGCIQGQYCALMTGPPNVAPTAFGNLSQTVSTANYRGKTAVFRVAV